MVKEELVFLMTMEINIFTHWAISCIKKIRYMMLIIHVRGEVSA